MSRTSLLTPRLRLTPIDESHLDEIVAIHRRNRNEFEGKMAKHFRTRRDALLLLSVGSRTERYAMIRKTDQTLLGTASIQNVEGWPFLNATLGYWIDSQYARQGYTREAVSRLVRDAFKRRGLHRLEANIEPENIGSVRLIKSLGFRLEGKSLRMLYLDGKWRDQLRFAITAEEWSQEIADR